MLHEEVSLAERSFEAKSVVRIPLRLQEELSDLIMAEDQSSRGKECTLLYANPRGAE
jgi:hypothetical protein